MEISSIENNNTICTAYFERYEEDILNGAYPVLKEGLIPININEEDGSVTRASTTDTQNPWYSYANQKWANAVILKNDYDKLEKEGKVHGAKKESSYVKFDGIDDYIDLDLENHDFNTDITMAIRLKFNVQAQTTVDILGNWEQSGGGIFVSENNKISVNFYDEKAKKYFGLEYYQLPTIDKYYTIVTTYNGKTLSMYVDGILVRSLNYEGKIAVSTAPIYIGANPATDRTAAAYSNINVKSVAIYDRALSAEEIKENFEGEMVVNKEDSKLISYQNFNKDYEEGHEIPEEEIESYFVWIPKYSYQLWDLGGYDKLSDNIDETKVHAIDIKFGTTNTTDSKSGECTTPMNAEKTQGLSGDTKNCEIGDYMTHPAFISFGVNGLWVGKFETGYEDATSKETGQVNPGSEEETISKVNEVIIKPNVYSWRNIQVANAFTVSYNYQRNLDSHMMKNTEWGAVAYLTNSIYGRCDKNTKKCTEVRINNNTSHITGYAGINEPNIGYTTTNEKCSDHPNACNEYGGSNIGKDGVYNYNYTNSKSVIASTTNNYTGIYDMSGGAQEYVMGVIENDLDSNNSGSGFNYKNNNSNITNCMQFPSNDKYYDLYKYGTSISNYQRRILGDATGEMGPFQRKIYKGTTENAQENAINISSWYNDYALYSNNFWFIRSGVSNHGSSTGVFNFGSSSGINSNWTTFRIVLALTEE